MNFLDEAQLTDNTLVLLLSDNGASQEGGPNGFVNARAVQWAARIHA